MSWGLLLATALAFPCDQATDAAVIGLATDPNTGVLQYCEHHYKIVAESTKQPPPPYSLPAEEVRVEYRSADEKLMAVKLLNYQGENHAKPWLYQIDLRQGEVRQVEWLNNQLLLSYRPLEQRPFEQKSLPAQQVDIVDAGFDHFIRRHWNVLLMGETVSSRFASPLHLQPLSLRVRTHPLNECGAPLHPKAAYCLWVEADSLWLRWLLQPLQLQYDVQQRLVRYRGVVNLVDAQGEPMTVNLDYRYCPCGPG
ncbi:hypothetical protein [Aestuariirhabdus sp. LZHN29]|uniref:hypothetical protein n=1 Tax=Aestuariirhabdus sp. LZHN29 TaxID=3417462 RepID=UPI003CFB7C9C